MQIHTVHSVVNELSDERSRQPVYYIQLRQCRREDLLPLYIRQLGKHNAHHAQGLDPIVNISLGGQINGYPIGYMPIGSDFEEDMNE